MPHHDSNVEPSESKSDVLPIAPWGNNLVGDLGIEPSCLTATDLQSAAVANAAHHPKLGGPRGARTHDLQVKSPLLYLLS